MIIIAFFGRCIKTFAVLTTQSESLWCTLSINYHTVQKMATVST